jgi:HSP20 family protein
MPYRTQLTPAFGLRREIDRLFEDAFGAGEATARRAFGPSVDVHEDQQALTFEFELPGISPEQVDVSFENGVLTVRGEKGAVREAKEGARFHHTERSYGTFTRSFQLPTTVDDAAIEASFDHGVLTVRVPKAQRPQRAVQGVAAANGSASGSREKSRETSRDEATAGSR